MRIPAKLVHHAANDTLLMQAKAFYQSFGFLLLEDALTDFEVSYLHSLVVDNAKKYGKEITQPDGSKVIGIDRSIIMSGVFESNLKTLEWFNGRPEYLMI